MIFSKRIRKLQTLLKKKNCDFLILDDLVSIYYLTGMHLSHGEMIVHTKAAHLFVDGRYLQAARQKSACSVSPISNEEKHKFILKYAKATNRVLFNSLASFVAYKAVQKLFKTLKTKKKFKILPEKNPVLEIRKIKDKEEIKAIAKSAKLNQVGFKYILSLLKEGITEEEVAFKYEYHCRKLKAQKVSFEPIIAFGTNTAMPHYQSGKKRLKKNDIVLIDIGLFVDHYASDMTRCVFVGKPNALLVKIYQIVKQAQNEALKLCRPGTKVKELDKAARGYIEKCGYGPLFVHALGHGIGLEVHEHPSLKAIGEDSECVLKEGMVITIEPGIYKENLGGVRYEDTIIITKTGYKNLYEKIP